MSELKILPNFSGIKDLNKIRSDAESLPKNNRGFRTRLSRDGMNFITEVKKASPSKGIISKESARQYAKQPESFL